MCLAEALLRIPDAETVDRLIRDKIAGADWEKHLGQSDSPFVNASTWALMLTGRVVKNEAAAGDLARRAAPLRRALGRAGGAPGGDLGDAHSRPPVRHGPHHRGGARPRPRAPSATATAIPTTCSARRRAPRPTRGAISKLRRGDRRDRHGGGGAQRRRRARHLGQALGAASALRGGAARAGDAANCCRALTTLAQQAKAVGIGFTIDAEEAERLELSLDIVEALAGDPSLAGWDGLGLAVQAYQKRALPLVDWLADLRARGIAGASWCGW